MFCKKCGKELKDGVSFCNYCGEKVTFKPEAPAYEVTDGFAKTENNAPDYSNSVQSVNYAQPVMNNNSYNQIPAQPQYPTAQAPAQEPFTPAYKPISAWGYFGYNLLFAIPLVGFICLIIFSLSNENINRRNYARSFWCWLVLALIIGVVFGVIGIITGGAIFSDLEHMF